MKGLNRRDFLEKLAKYGSMAIFGAVIVSAAGCETTNETYTYTVNTSKCNGCGECLSACKHNAISVSSVASISGSRCIGCGDCAKRCKQNAIVISD